MPIEKSIKETIKLVIQNLAKKIRIAYASLASNITNLNRFHLSKLYNSLTVPYLLAMTLIWNFFSASDKKNINQIYFKFAKYLLHLPP